MALVNQSFVNRYCPNEDLIGKQIIGDWANSKPKQVIGIVSGPLIKRRPSSVRLVDHHQKIPSPHIKILWESRLWATKICRVRSPGVTARNN